MEPLKLFFHSRTIEAVQKSLKDGSPVENSWPYCCGLNGDAGFFQPSVKIHNIDGQLDISLSLKCNFPSLELEDDETPLFSHSETKVLVIRIYLSLVISFHGLENYF